MDLSKLQFVVCVTEEGELCNVSLTTNLKEVLTELEPRTIPEDLPDFMKDHFMKLGKGKENLRLVSCPVNDDVLESLQEVQINLKWYTELLAFRCGVSDKVLSQELEINPEMIEEEYRNFSHYLLWKRIFKMGFEAGRKDALK